MPSTRAGARRSPTSTRVSTLERGSTAATFGRAASASSCAVVSASGRIASDTSARRSERTSACMARSSSVGIEKKAMLATASASVATVNAVRALRRDRSVTDLRSEAETIRRLSRPRRRRRGS